MWLSALAHEGHATTPRPSAAAAAWPGARMTPGEAVLGLWRRDPDPGAGAGAASRPAAAVLRDDLVVLARCPTPTPLAHYAPGLRRELGLHQEHADLRHASPAASTSCSAVAIAYLVLRTKLIGRRMARLDGHRPRSPFPASCSASAISATFYGVNLPDGTPLATLWIIIVLALAIRRLPYALRACLRGAAADLGLARGGRRKPRRHQGPHRAPRRRCR